MADMEKHNFQSYERLKSIIDNLQVEKEALNARLLNGNRERLN